MSDGSDSGAGEASRQRRIISTVIVVLFIVSIAALVRWMNQAPPPPDIPVNPARPMQEMPGPK